MFRKPNKLDARVYPTKMETTEGPSLSTCLMCGTTRMDDDDEFDVEVRRPLLIINTVVMADEECSEVICRSCQAELTAKNNM